MATITAPPATTGTARWLQLGSLELLRRGLSAVLEIAARRKKKEYKARYLVSRWYGPGPTGLPEHLGFRLQKLERSGGVGPVYPLAFYPGGKLGCSCQDALWRRGPLNCKHVKALEKALGQQ